VSFLLLRLIPGDPAEILLAGNPGYTLEDVERVRRTMGLDQPIYVQYYLYIGRLMMGDWGESIYGNEKVLTLVIHYFRNTLELTIVSLIIASAVGLSLGIIAALKKDTFLDGLIRTFSLLGYSMPSYWLGLLLILTFSVVLNLFPPLGRGTVAHIILPAATLATYSSSTIGRVSRACILDVMTEDFVLTAKSKGMSSGRILFRHVMPNALIPIITIIGLQLGNMLGGAVITETVFAYPGIGWLLINNIQRRDYTIVQGGILLTSLMFVLINYVVDIVYAYVDPRVRY
jgi:ABC-type dipeptide/oligopeptide/nickel transport system permease component